MQSVLSCLVHARAWLRPGRSCATYGRTGSQKHMVLTHIHISEPTRLGMNSNAVICMKKKKKKKNKQKKQTKKKQQKQKKKKDSPSKKETKQIVCNVRENRGTNTHG